MSRRRRHDNTTYYRLVPVDRKKGTSGCLIFILIPPAISLFWLVRHWM